MTTHQITAERIVKTAASLWATQGYSTSLETLARACGLHKATLYHYFSSREVLIVAVVKHIGERLHAELFSLLAKEGTPRARRVESLLKSLAAFFIPSAECVSSPSHFLLEVASRSPQAAPQVRACFKEWEQAITALLVSQQNRGVAERLALEIMTQLQGAALFSRVWPGERTAEQALTHCATLLRKER